MKKLHLTNFALDSSATSSVIEQKSRDLIRSSVEDQTMNTSHSWQKNANGANQASGEKVFGLVLKPHHS